MLEKYKNDHKHSLPVAAAAAAAATVHGVYMKILKMTFLSLLTRFFLQFHLFIHIFT